MRLGARLLATVFQMPRYWQAEAAIRDQALFAIERVGLAAHAMRRAGDLSYGDQRKVEIARALALQPRLLLLDEPAAGLNPTETSNLMELIRSLVQDDRICVLLVEHDMRLVMALCDRIQVVNRGEFVAEGNAHEVQANPAVIEAYLGTRRNKMATTQMEPPA